MDAASWARAKDLLAEALKLAPSEREIFVRAHCSSPELSSEVLAMLSAYADGTDFLGSGPSAPDADEGKDDEDLQPGTHVGPYVIIDRIGRGGMGHVFLGNDPRLHRKVALKCLARSAPVLGSPGVQILNEARASARISHPHVAAVHDVLQHGRRMFIVMEYVEGESLAARLKRERLPIARVVEIGRQLASALAAAHAKGIVHRDLKPANVQFTGDGSVKVLDFGIANLPRTMWMMDTSVPTTRGAGASTPATPHPGTPPYMSPEQLLGRPIDERSDLYSLGVVLFEMATGRRPFASTDALELIHAQAKGAPRADAVDPAVPRMLADVIARAMAIEIAPRYPSAVDIELALEQVERQLEADQVSLGDLLRRWLTRAAVALPIAVAVVGLSGFITTAGFNETFGRSGPYARFGVEPLPKYFEWGARAVFPSTFIMMLTAIAVIAARFVLHVLGLIGPIGRAMTRVRDSARRIAAAIGLDKPPVLAQALTGVAIATLVAFCWYHADLIGAWTSLFNSAPIAALLPMGESTKARLEYQVELSVMILAFGFGLFKAIQLRRRMKMGEGRAALAVLAGVVVVMILMYEWPYRTFIHRDFERIDVGGVRCYITGETAVDVLALCPGVDPPRNRVVRREDARRPGITENVFRGVTAPSGAVR